MVIKEIKTQLLNAITEVRTAIDVSETFDIVLRHLIRVNQNWELSEDYVVNDVFDIDEWKSMSIDYFKINKKRLWYILETIENEFLSIETDTEDTNTNTNKNENISTNSNIDYNGGEGINDKNTNNQNQEQNFKGNRKDKTIDKREYLDNFRTITNNALFRDWLILWVNDMIFWE